MHGGWEAKCRVSSWTGVGKQISKVRNFEEGCSLSDKAAVLLDFFSSGKSIWG